MTEIEKLRADLEELAKAVTIQQEIIEMLIPGQKAIIDCLKTLARERHGE